VQSYHTQECQEHAQSGEYPATVGLSNTRRPSASSCKPF